MSGGPTIIVKFGESVADGSFFLVALDDAMNVNVPEGRIIQRIWSKGEQYFVIYFGVGDIRTLPAEGVKSQFSPGDPVYFLLHYDPTKLRVADIKTTAGTLARQGNISRSATDELLFTEADEAQTLSHIPNGSLAVSFFGRWANLARDGMQIEADTAPVLCKVSYNFAATGYKFVPPPMTLGVDDEYPVAIVVYVEAAA
ncbi:MAG: hypothetical protein ACOYB1_18425 [Limnohabitans sp.]